MKRTLIFLPALMWLLAACNGSMFMTAPAATPVPPPAPTPTPRYYVVEPGDTLWSIANKTGVDINVLVQVNELANPDDLHPGDRLLISDRVTISGQVLPTPTPTPIPCLHGCVQPPPGCVIKAYHARLDGMKLYVTPGDEIYGVQRAELWFCRQMDATAAGWRRWTPDGPAAP